MRNIIVPSRIKLNNDDYIVVDDQLVEDKVHKSGKIGFIPKKTLAIILFLCILTLVPCRIHTDIRLYISRSAIVFVLL